MKKIIILIVLSFTYSAMSQSLSVFDVDASNFPTIKAKFYAFDKDGKQLTNLNPNDFELKENGQSRNVTNVSCPPPQPPIALSSVLVFDVSGSMSSGPPRIQSAKDAANAWIDGLPLGQSECALVSFNSYSNIVQDFTISRDKLKVAIGKLNPNGGTNYNQALIDLPAGGLQIAKNGKYKKVVIFLTDGLPNNPPNVNEIIKFAKENQITIYAVTLDMPAPKSIKDITTQTGGQYFENITTQKEAEETYRKLLQSAQGGDPCEIEWQSRISCAEGNTNVEIKLLTNQTITKTSYQSPNTSIAKLEFNPSSVKFLNPEIGVKVEKKVTVTARNSDFIVSNITTNNVAFTITPTNFMLNNGESTELTVSYLPADSGYNYCRFEIENDICPVKYYASGGWIGIKPKVKTIKLIHPNGGEKFVIGSDTVITWEGIPENETVKLEYTIDNGVTWKTITDKAIELQYIWRNIPKPSSNQCKVRIKPFDINKEAVLQHTLIGHDDLVSAVSWSPDGTRIATTSYDNTTRIWDADTGVMLHKLIGHTQAVYDVSWSPDGTRIVTACVDASPRIWDTETGITLHTLIGHTQAVFAVSWSPDDSRIATVSFDKTARIWNADNGNLLHTLSGHTAFVWEVDWSPDGSRIITVSGDSTAKIWDAENGALLHTLSGHNSDVYAGIWSPDGSRIVTTSTDNNARIWDAGNGALLHTLIGHNSVVNAASWSPNGLRVATASGDTTIIIWDANTGAFLNTLIGHENKVYAVSWSSDGLRIVTASTDKTARIWDAETGDTQYILRGHTGDIYDVKWSPDGSRIATASDDRTARIWDAGGYSYLQEDESDNVFSIVAPSAIAIDIDMGQCLVSSSKDSVFVEFIQNVGSYKFRVDSIYIQGADADAFSLVSGFPKYIIESNQNHFAEFRFTPNRIGIHSAEIVIVTQAETLKQKISGEGVAPSLELVSKFIDFGEVFIQNSKDTLQVVTIKNISNSPIQITNTKHNYPNDIDFTTLSGGGNFILQAGEESKMDLKFKPSDVGRTSGTLEFHYNGYGSPLILNLFGDGVDRKLSIMNEFTDFPTMICNVSESKPLLLNNTGQTKLTINDIKIINDIESNFSTDATYPIELHTNEEITLNISFKSENPGVKTALLEIISNSFPNPKIEIPLKGRKEIVSYETDVSLIDFEVLMYNTHGSKSFILTNTGTIQNTYSIILEGNYDISHNVVTLNPNEQATIEVTYNGSTNNMSFNDNLTIKDDLCSIEKQIIITGSVSTSSATIQVPKIEANAGDEISIPIILQNQQNLKYSGATAMRVDLEFNPTLLYPLDYGFNTIDNKTAKISIDNLPIDKSDGEVLTNIRFKVGLGNAESCKLTLSNAETVGGEAEIQVVDGTFTLLGICEEGGTRLLNPYSKAGITSISPNPAENLINIELSLSEIGNTELSLYNLLGEKVSTIYSESVSQKSIFEVSSDISKIGSGQYLLIFRTPTYTETRQLLILR